VSGAALRTIARSSVRPYCRARHRQSSPDIVNERKPILELIASLGYAVSVHRVNGVVEMHAVKLADPSEQHISRVIDGDGTEEDYRCACELAQMVGIDLEDG
jgi:hypothetical protein